MRLYTKFAFTTLCLSAAACGVTQDASVEDSDIAETAPADSSGAMTALGFSFSSSAATSLNLEEQAQTLKIGESIELSYAKFSIAKIKVKANKDRSSEEKDLDTQEAGAEKEAVKKLEADLGYESETMALAKPADAGQAGKSKSKKMMAKDERQERIAGKRDVLKHKEKEEMEKEGRKDRATKLVGPYVYDAITGKIDGDMPEVEIKDGSYRRIEFQLKRNFEVAQDEPLLGNVFVIKGTVKKGDALVPFEIEWHTALNFRLSGSSAFKVEASEDNKMQIDFDLSKWFVGIDLSRAAVDETDGTIYISKTSNRGIMRALHRNIKTTAHFGKDANHDGKLKDSERSGSGEETDDASVED